VNEARKPAQGLARRRPVLAYFALTFAISWLGALLVVAPALVKGRAVSKTSGLLMFPAMLLGPLVAGVVLTRVVDGPGGLRRLAAQATRMRVPLRWYLPLLLPPGLVLAVLFLLKSLFAPSFAPNTFLIGMAFGVPAGLLEEIGWTGYALPKMSEELGAMRAGVLLGILWGLWHLPVIDFLGTATPHGRYLGAFLLAFLAAMTAMRVLISWIFANSGSLLLAQAMHIVSTASLVVFGPSRVSAAQEAAWYGVYGAALWIVVAVVLAAYGKRLQMGAPSAGRRSKLPV